MKMKIEKVKSLPNGYVEIVASEVDSEAKKKLARSYFTEEALFPMFPDEVCNDSELEIVGIWQSGNRTALKLADGTTYRARPEAGDKFDPEKGVMMCLLKACGISSTDFLEVLKRVEVVKPEISLKNPNGRKTSSKNMKKVG
jgi:hypothetical protein